MLGLGLSIPQIAVSAPGTGGGSLPGPYPPPSGYRWEYVTENGAAVTENGSPDVELVRIN